MRRGKYQAPRRKLPVTLWIILLVAVIGTSIGGTRAYLSHSAGPVTNTFVQNEDPAITVNDDYTITVEANYNVYLRAAVVANWKQEDGSILAAVPQLGTDYSVSDEWELINGFYYYKKVVTSSDPISAIITVMPDKETLQVDVAVQAIQAVGTTDSTNPIGAIDAVEHAWRVAATEFLGN